jgi:thiol:disulfide interchange protein
MQPIVNGLEAEFREQLAFVHVDANTEDGQALMRAYGLRGHPSYVIVASDGQAHWQFTGSFQADALRRQVCRYGGRC